MNLQKIAREAEEQLEYRNLFLPETHERNRQVILSAIERATEAFPQNGFTREELYRYLHHKHGLLDDSTEMNELILAIRTAQLEPQEEGDATCPTMSEQPSRESNAAPTVQPPSAAEHGIKKFVCRICGSDAQRVQGGWNCNHGEQQEWTPEYLLNMVQTGNDDEMTTRITDAHNAALAAERQRGEQAEKEQHRAFNYITVVEKDRDSLRQQLLSAQAAIGDTLTRWRKKLAYLDSIKLTEAGNASRYELNKCIEELETFDLSLLHQHDAEVSARSVMSYKTALDEVRAVVIPKHEHADGINECWMCDHSLTQAIAKHVTEANKPLVEALEKLRDRIKMAHGFPNFGSEEIHEIDAALA